TASHISRCLDQKNLPSLMKTSLNASGSSLVACRRSSRPNAVILGFHRQSHGLEIERGAFQDWLQDSVDAVEDLLYRRCFPLARLLDQGVDHRPRFGPLAIVVTLGQGRPEQRREAHFGRRPALGVAALAGLEWSSPLLVRHQITR